MVASPLFAFGTGQQTGTSVTLEDLRSFAKIAGIQMSDEELTSVLPIVANFGRTFDGVRKQTESYDLLPTATFRVSGAESQRETKPEVILGRISAPKSASDADLAFLTVHELGTLLRNKKISSVELTKVFLRRIKELNPQINCIVTLCEDLALREAAQADAEIAAGKVRGPLHGIPYGIKDLFAVKGYPTQWGTAAFRGQVIDADAAVVAKLRAAGAVLVAKLSLGALAMDDKWFGGQTKNPWNLNQGSSGSSAGSAAAVAAGLCAFAIGTETSGSIVSPSHRCRVTGLRPTFGSVSRYGAMCLAWSMDKAGPICRTAEDAALVFAALLGHDPCDPGSIGRSFKYRSPKDLKGVRIGVVGSTDSEPAQCVAGLGAVLTPLKAPPTLPGTELIITVESSAMFDRLTRSEQLALVTENSWPRTFRQGRFVPAVEYVQAERVRQTLKSLYQAAFADVDLVLAADTGAAMIYSSNLAGYPQLYLPYGQVKGAYAGVSLLAKPFGEAMLIGAAHLIQNKTQFYRERPPMATGSES